MNIGIFTTLKVRNSIPLFWDKHQKRLVEQSKKLNLGSFSITLQEIVTYIRNNNFTSCALKITVDKQKGSLFTSIQHRDLPQITDIYKVITCVDNRNYRKIYKTTDRAVNEQAKKFAEENGANDALFTLNENLVESTIANIFSLNKKGEIITPPIKARGLNGITRQLIMQNTKVIETEINQNTNGPLVLVNCLRIQKVSHLNGKKLIDGQLLAQKLKTTIDSQEKK